MARFPVYSLSQIPSVGISRSSGICRSSKKIDLFSLFLWNIFVKKQHASKKPGFFCWIDIFCWILYSHTQNCCLIGIPRHHYLSAWHSLLQNWSCGFCNTTSRFQLDDGIFSLKPSLICFLEFQNAVHLPVPANTSMFCSTSHFSQPHSICDYYTITTSLQSSQSYHHD